MFDVQKVKLGVQTLFSTVSLQLQTQTDVSLSVFTLSDLSGKIKGFISDVLPNAVVLFSLVHVACDQNPRWNDHFRKMYLVKCLIPKE